MPVVESFTLDHTKVKAPYVRVAGYERHRLGSVVQKFDLRFLQPNADAIPTAALHTLVAAMLATGADVKVMRDPTRGGLAATLTELSSAGGVGVVVDEAAVPVPAQVRDACGILGLDPFHVANEGKLVAVVASADAPDLVAAMRAHPLGRGACVIGRVVADHPGVVVARTPLGGTRVVDPPLGEQLPRIC